jgi:hypothetical protein
VHAVEQVVIDALHEIGLTTAARFDGYPGVWLDVDTATPRKICAIGVRVGRGRTMHGFAINVHTDLEYMTTNIVPCGIAEYPVTSIAAEGIDVTMAQFVDIVARHAALLDPTAQRLLARVAHHEVRDAVDFAEVFDRDQVGMVELREVTHRVQFAPHCVYFASRGMMTMAFDYRVAARHQAGPLEAIADARSATSRCFHRASK